MRYGNQSTDFKKIQGNPQNLTPDGEGKRYTLLWGYNSNFSTGCIVVPGGNNGTACFR